MVKAKKGGSEEDFMALARAQRENRQTCFERGNGDDSTACWTVQEY